MIPTKFRLVRFGSARALTRDGLGVQFYEMNIRNSQWPACG